MARFVLALLTLFFVSNTALADLDDTAIAGNSTMTAVWTANGWEVDLRVFNLSGSGALVLVESYNTLAGIPESDPIASITIQVDTSPATVVIQRRAGVPSGHTVPYIRTLGKSGTGTLTVSIQNIDGDLGLASSSPNDTFESDIFGTIEIEGSVYADLVPQNVANGNVGLIDIDGNLDGSIITPSGGVISGPIFIGGSQTDGIIESDAINDDIIITGNVRRIRVRTGPYSNDLNVGQIGSSSTSLTAINLGSFSGSLVCDGDVYNNLSLGEDWGGSNEVISIGGSLAARTGGSMVSTRSFASSGSLHRLAQTFSNLM